nr:DUF1589 domain-containing protein [Rhodopirellula bahusiensis]
MEQSEASSRSRKTQRCPSNHPARYNLAYISNIRILGESSYQEISHRLTSIARSAARHRAKKQTARPQDVLAPPVWQ